MTNITEILRRNIDILTICDIPVSYTHLDVYKRQFYEVPIYFYSDKVGLGNAIGKEFRASLAVTDENLAKMCIRDRYTAPIPVPEGNNVLSVIAIDQNTGKCSDIYLSLIHI